MPDQREIDTNGACGKHKSFIPLQDSCHCPAVSPLIDCSDSHNLSWLLFAVVPATRASDHVYKTILKIWERITADTSTTPSTVVPTAATEVATGTERIERRDWDDWRERGGGSRGFLS